MVHPGGPSSQRRTSSGLVNASKTRRRGASKSLVTRISRSPRVDILKLSGNRAIPLLLPGGPTAFLIGGLQLAKQTIEPRERRLPKGPVGLQPLRRFREGARNELTRPPLRVPTAHNET